MTFEDKLRSAVEEKRIVAQAHHDLRLDVEPKGRAHPSGKG
jgi:hypothetical protein